MRILLRVSNPVETGNAAAKDGTLGTTIEKIFADLKPEAAYSFADDNGNRSGSTVFDMRDTSEIPGIAEPWFLAFNPRVSFRPVRSCEGRSCDRQGRQEIRAVGSLLGQGERLTRQFGASPSCSALLARSAIRSLSAKGSHDIRADRVRDHGPLVPWRVIDARRLPSVVAARGFGFHENAVRIGREVVALLIAYDRAPT